MISEEKKQELINKINPQFTVISEFKGLRKDIVRKCNTCGDVRTVKARSLIEKDNNGNYRECIVCKSKKRGLLLRKTHNQFAEELKHINTNIKLLSEYISNDQKIKCKCVIDNFEWETYPKILSQGHGCPACSHRKQNWRDNEKFLKDLHDRFPNIIVLEEFHKSSDVLTFHCCDCEYEWRTAANVLLNMKGYHGCPKCNGFAPVLEQEMINRLKKSNDRVKYVCGYKGIDKHATFKCKLCDNVWNTLVSSVLSGRGCPKCNMSQGELKINKILSNLSVEYKSEYIFDDCRNIRPLPFDFYLPQYNTCIEYQGEQHYKPVRFDKNNSRGTPQERFEELQRRDKIKTDYCKNNNINLIRIPYTDYNKIEEILNEYLS